MKQVQMRDLVKVLEEMPSVKRILFMGGNTKNGPEFLFKKLLKQKGIKFRQESEKSPRIHTVEIMDRQIKAISLISPSSAANRSIGANPMYKERKSKEPKYSTLEFRIEQYKEFFLD